MPALKKTHFPEGAWSDFVRDLASPSVRAGMEEHLRSGCAECAASLRFVREMLDFARAERSVEVPETLVSAAVSIFRPRPVESWMDTFERLAAELLQDLRGDGQLVGVRSAGGGPRRLVYRAGPYGLDLSLESCPDSGLNAITGQIAHDGGEGLGDAVVQVWVDGAPVAETRANPYGEFVAEHPAGMAVELRIGLLASGRRLDVSLPAVQ